MCFSKVHIPGEMIGKASVQYMDYICSIAATGNIDTNVNHTMAIWTYLEKWLTCKL